MLRPCASWQCRRRAGPDQGDVGDSFGSAWIVIQSRSSMAWRSVATERAGRPERAPARAPCPLSSSLLRCLSPRGDGPSRRVEPSPAGRAIRKKDHRRPASSAAADAIAMPIPRTGFGRQTRGKSTCCSARFGELIRSPGWQTHGNGSKVSSAGSLTTRDQGRERAVRVMDWLLLQYKGEENPVPCPVPVKPLFTWPEEERTEDDADTGKSGARHRLLNGVLGPRNPGDEIPAWWYTFRDHGLMRPRPAAPPSQTVPLRPTRFGMRVTDTCVYAPWHRFIKDALGPLTCACASGDVSSFRPVLEVPKPHPSSLGLAEEPTFAAPDKRSPPVHFALPTARPGRPARVGTDSQFPVRPGSPYPNRPGSPSQAPAGRSKAEAKSKAKVRFVRRNRKSKAPIRAVASLARPCSPTGPETAAWETDASESEAGTP